MTGDRPEGAPDTASHAPARAADQIRAWCVVGAILELLGVGMVAATNGGGDGLVTVLGLLLAQAGAVCLLVGVIGHGVRLGNRAAREDMPANR